MLIACILFFSIFSMICKVIIFNSMKQAYEPCAHGKQECIMFDVFLSSFMYACVLRDALLNMFQLAFFSAFVFLRDALLNFVFPARDALLNIFRGLL